MKRKKYQFLLIGLLLCSGMSFCDNSLDPLDRDLGIYSIYGFLDLNEETHFIRIRDLNAPFTLQATESIDAAVSLQNLTRETIDILESRVKVHQGANQHTFEYHTEIIPEDEFLLSVERSDGMVVQIPITAPTKPEPKVVPQNQNCYVPINFEMDPLKGSTVVLQVGVRISDPRVRYRWNEPIVLSAGDKNTPGDINYTFTPQNQLDELFIFQQQCDRLKEDDEEGDTGYIYLNYIHYGPGFYEQLEIEPFDIEDTHQFGALYFDTLAIPVDTRPVCPQDC